MPRSRGFTVLELLVALAVGGMLVLMAHGAFGASVTLAAGLRERQTSHDEIAVTGQYLVAAFGGVDAASEGSGGFSGGPTRIAFATWTESGLERVTLALADGRLVATTETDTVRLMRVASMDADFLLEYGAVARWVRAWQSPVSAPLAVRLRLLRGDSSGIVDTLLLAIGPRG